MFTFTEEILSGKLYFLCNVDPFILGFLFSDFTDQIADLLNPFWVDVSKPLETSENFWFSDAFRRSRLVIFFLVEPDIR